MQRPATPSVSAGSAQYRQRHAEPEVHAVASCPDTFDHVLVVPACGESAALLDGFHAAASRAGRLLVIVVLNGREDADDTVHVTNAACFQALRATLHLAAIGDGCWTGASATQRVLVVDRFSPGRRLPPRQGVGLARKIGGDIALEFVATNRVRSPFVAMMDADARLPRNYFPRIAKLPHECSAAVFPFWHEPCGDRTVDRATALYEVRLRYFQRGLQWAQSPFAFHSMGSTMVIHALRYAQVRGVPARQAAEDFYLLDKLSKVRPLTCVRGAPIRIHSRVSNRVPFGTGAETAKLVLRDTMTLYHPDCFGAVRATVKCIEHWSRLRRGEEPRWPPDLSVAARTYLESQGAPGVWRSLHAQAPTALARLRCLHEWFDGFRTLKLIHAVRDRIAPSLPWQDAVRAAPFMDDIRDDGDRLLAARAELLRLEQRQPRLLGSSIYR